MAVLVRITDYATQLFTGFYCRLLYFRLHRRYYNRSSLTQTVLTIALSVDSRTVPYSWRSCTRRLAVDC
jgi:hypothetical protein